MRFSYRLTKEASGFVAECVEADAAAEARTREGAVEALRRALEERMYRPDAIAPPSHPNADRIDLVLVNAEDLETSPDQEMRELDEPE